MIEGKTREETIRLTAAFLEISLIEAAFIWGQEHGTIKGDVIVVEEKRDGRTDNRQHGRT